MRKKREMLKQLFDLAMDIWRYPNTYKSDQEIILDWLEIAPDTPDLANELIDRDICPKCGGQLRLDRNSQNAYLRCYGCDTKY